MCNHSRCYMQFNGGRVDSYALEMGPIARSTPGDLAERPLHLAQTILLNVHWTWLLWFFILWEVRRTVWVLWWKAPVG